MERSSCSSAMVLLLCAPPVAARIGRDRWYPGESHREVDRRLHRPLLAEGVPKTVGRIPHRRVLDGRRNGRFLSEERGATFEDQESPSPFRVARRWPTRMDAVPPAYLV